MKRVRCVPLVIAAFVLAPAPAFAQSAPSAQVDHSAHEREIRETNARWLQLIKAGDAPGVAQLYAEDGALMPPNAPIAVGREAVEAGWRSMFEMPGFALTFATDEIIFADSHDLAVERGTYRFSASPPGGAISDVGKFVVAWRRTGGEWKVVADIFNSDRAP